MLPHTHLAIGLVLSEAMYHGSPMKQALVAIGSCLPDVPIVVKYVYDKISERKPFEVVGNSYWRAYHVTHGVFLNAWFVILSIPMAVGVYSHILMDILSHGRYTSAVRENPFYFWPLSLRLRGPLDLRKKTLDFDRKVERWIAGACFTAALALHFLW